MAQLSSTTIYGDLTVTGNTNISLNITSAGDFAATGDLYGASIYLEEDANSSYYLRLLNNSGLTANKTLTLNTNNTDRTISLSGDVTSNVAFTAGATSTYTGAITVRSAGTSATTITGPNGGEAVLSAGTMAITGGKLSQFAATTSAELAGVISDETGSGALVFGTSPTFTTDVRINHSATSTATLDVRKAYSSSSRVAYLASATDTVLSHVTYDTVAIYSGDVTTVRIAEADGTQLGLVAGDEHATITSTDDLRFFTGSDTTTPLYSGANGRQKLIIHNSSTLGATLYGGTAEILEINGTGSATGIVFKTGAATNGYVWADIGYNLAIGPGSGANSIFFRDSNVGIGTLSTTLTEKLSVIGNIAFGSTEGKCKMLYNSTEVSIDFVIN